MKPLVHDDTLTDDERELLRSARADLPSPALRAQTLAALGLGGAALGSTVTAHAAGKAAAAATGAGAAGGGSAITAAVITKWLAAGALVGAVASSSVVLVVEATRTASVESASTRARGPSPVVAATPGAQATFPPAGSRAGAQEAPLRPVDELPSAAAPEGEAMPVAARAAASGPPATRSGPGDELGTGAGELTGSAAFALPEGARESRIAAEVASLDSARAALGASDPVGALARLGAHARKFPGGALEPEAVLLRVRALVALGRVEEARAVAARFLDANPGSPQAARLQAAVGAAGR